MPYAIAGPSSPAIPSLDGINRATDRISSGLRTDNQFNAAQTAISGRLDTLVGESTIEIKNSLQQISAIQKADQTLGQGKDIVERIQELSIQSGNSILSEADQSAIADEVSSLVSDLDDLLENAKFNGDDLFGRDTTEVLGAQARVDELSADLAQSKTANLDDLERLSNEFSSLQSELGAKQNGLEQRIESTIEGRSNLAEANSRISDTDIAVEVASLIREQIQFEASVKVFDHQRMAEESIMNLLN